MIIKSNLVFGNFSQIIISYSPQGFIQVTYEYFSACGIFPYVSDMECEASERVE
jgi:hypothetical protein